MNMLMKSAFNLINKVPIVKERIVVQLTIVSNFHNNNQALYNENKPGEKLSLYRFSKVENKTKESFLEFIHLYTKTSVARRTHVEFIAQALKHMSEFGVERDLEVYKALLNVFPKGKYIPRNMYQTMLYHFPKHQDVTLQLLTQMEQNHVIPDYEMQELVINIFGEKSHPIQKLWRMVYWMPKFCKLNPWPVPVPMPTDPQELAQYAIKKICSTDVQASVTHYRTKDLPDAVEDTWIISTMSRTQQELLAIQPTNKSLCIEGPFMIWVADKCIDYFVLKGDPIQRKIIYEDYDDVSDLKIPFWEKLHTKMPVTIHEQDDGVYYAMCATGTSSKDSLISWIRCLQKTNPILFNIPITFKLKSLIKESPLIEDSKKDDLRDITKFRDSH
ncbi:evolutionarily conserved signaling intermediate in Toll pathway, mitochondrial [Colletes latitarsis]|uniref:evolutionarily conserved signaling intermediate in Toll pathway, mitochondrial n=1 Tax=Colletes latitarsis TaxID=2605962 RepID=UPI0040373389